MEKYRLTRQELETSGAFHFAVGPLASREDLLAVHAAEYVDAVLEGRLSAEQVRRIGFPQIPELITRSLSSVGAAMAAARLALGEGWSGVLAGGTHHAYRDFGSGYCVFNDIAVAAAMVLREGLAQRVAVVDLDVHQGDGTASIFAGSDRVFCFSAHGRNNFPFRKQQSHLDLEFEDGVGDAEYLALLPPALDRVRAFEPEIVFYQAGVDALKTDRLGKLALTMEGMRRRDEMVFEWFHEVPCVVTLGGGYSDPIALTVQAAATTYRTADQILRAISPTDSRPSE
ncbi:histone deacetylase [Bryobacter aggregatus]|uniref:histone deacetylase family protein n=1 Tax=Bryobacter aggregatus TaxID=360054 RepID=UPI001EE38CF1|nr:histone deacetylase [Bryobacter aggregatus]